MSTVVVLAGGSPHAHDFAAVGAALAELVESAGHDAVLTADPDAASARLDAVDALVINGLWWRMLDEKYDAWRAEHAYTPPPATRDRLHDFVAAGGGLVAMHTTSICFDDWPGWGDVIGGAWHWGRSAHPPQGPVTATLADDRRDHPVVAGLPDRLELDDEVYGDLDLRDGIDVLATARRHADDAPHPVLWTHRYGRGRVVYDGFGHDVASIGAPRHAQLIRQAIDWTLGVTDA